MDKDDVVHVYNGVLLSHKKEWNKHFAVQQKLTQQYKSTILQFLKKEEEDREMSLFPHAHKEEVV